MNLSVRGVGFEDIFDPVTEKRGDNKARGRSSPPVDRTPFGIMTLEKDSSEYRPPFEALLDYCRSNRIAFRSNQEAKVVAISINGAAALYELALQVTPNDQLLQVSLEMPVLALDPELLPRVAESVARANGCMILGNVDLDMDTGRLRYRIGHVIGSLGCEVEIIKALIGMAVEMSDRYFPALMRVMFAGVTPSEAMNVTGLDRQTYSKGKSVEG
jgi:hypothetical protein